MYTKLRKIVEEKLHYWEQDIRDDDVMDFSENDLMEAIQQSDAFKLYRYMPVDYFNIRNIETQTIHLSANGVMNDIYEGLPIFDDKTTYSYFELQKLSDMAFMTCLSEENNNVLMWSHYAKQHEGVCVEYNFKLLKEDRYEIIRHLFPVIYRKRRTLRRDVDSIIKSHKELNKAIENHYVYEGDEPFDDVLPLFITKGMDWAYEKEWRVIYTKKQLYDLDDDVLYGGNIMMNCISAVYLGYRIHPEVKKNIVDISRRMNAANRPMKVYQARLDAGKYNIHFEEICY